MPPPKSPTRVALVTGASGGLGLAIAARLANEHGMKVFLLARNRARGDAAVAEVNARSAREDAELLSCDLGSLQRVRRAAEELSGRTPRLDVLVNNAGLITLKRELTEDGFEKQLGVNHLGHFALTGLLMSVLGQSDDARVVVVSSGAHKVGRMDFDDPHLERAFSVWGAYGRSKLANLWFTRELARRHGSPRFTVNAFHPGAVATQLGVDRKTGFGKTVHRLLRPLFLSPEQAAETALYLATSEEVRGHSGGYYYRSCPAKVGRRASDDQASRRLWAWSENATGCHF